ncbi:hypothetical protein DYB34_003401 [Aphanomyces astaci]|uniref:Uncharacterized protein n=3 Tax=Aphanomyces astaci TaxID=112090 RepID=A0A3R6VYT5_APHAT|nr:hypothetical protein DYB34_003401 [Aphanomyces astaci]
MPFVRFAVVALVAIASTTVVMGACKTAVGGSVTVNKLGDAFYLKAGTLPATTTPHRIIPVQTKEKYLEAREDGPVQHGPLQLSRLATVLGFLYLAVTVSCSAWYLKIVEPHLDNDLWLPHFNSTGMQTYLGDLIHLRRNLNQVGTFDVSLPDSTLLRAYGEVDTLLTLPPSNPRQTLLDSIPFDDVITTIRMQSLDTYLAYRIPYCWADMSRRFEMAHTVTRQARCAAADKDNAAVYLETVLRNTEVQAILAWPLFDLLNETVLVPMTVVDAVEGPKWIASIVHGSLLPVADEVRFWDLQGLHRFTLQLQNTFPQRIDDAILLEDALGMQQRFTISSMSVTSPERGAGTTFWTSLSLSSDLTVASAFGCSIVRGSPNDAAALGLSWDTDLVYAQAAGFVGTDLMRANVGPLGSIDIRTIPVPPALTAYFLAFRAGLYDYLQQDSNARKVYFHLSEPVVSPVPATWGGLSYYGGNPMCVLQSSATFVQPSFGISDDCAEQVPYTMTLRRENVFFALISSGLSIDQLGFVCNLSSTSSDQCLATLFTALPLVTVWNQTTAFGNQSPPPITAMSNLNISFMQFASAIDDTTSQSFLLQPLVAANDMWSFYGWVGIHEWLSGRREVYSFEGDIATLTVLTEAQDEVYLVANDLEIPRKGCFYIWVITIYVTFVLVLVVSLMICYAFFIGFHVEWWNLFQCNWVIGYVWIGRPFLFLRGMTAMLLLSSSTVSFANNLGFARISFTPKPLIHTMVLAGESTWLTIVLHDILLPFTDQELTVYAPLSTAFIWAIMTVIQVVSPHGATLTLDRTCSYEFVGLSASCTSATVQFGSVRRFGLLFIVHVASIALAYLIVKVYYTVTGRRRAHGNVVAHVLIPGVAQAFFIQSGNGELFLDRVACVMCGMFSYRDTIFHAPSWIVLHLHAHNGIGFLFDVAKFVMKPLSAPETIKKHKYIRILGLVGLVNMGMSVTGSWAYLGQVKDIMSNDFWWAGFNTTGHQTYLCNWFNRQLNEPTLGRSVELQMNQLEYAEVGTDNHYNATDTVVYVAPLYASAIQLEVNTLSNVITGLRAMQGCDVPWIATAYCYVDFGRKWEMANSETRQARCLTSERQNAAVYLDAVLRNADWASLTSCWQDSLSTGVFSYLNTFQDGKTWLQTLPSGLAIHDELQFWQANGISEYVTQWQNYKQLGIVETFDVQNAFGFTYPMTIKRSRGSFRTELGASSFKMSWGLASDLWAVATNLTLIGGLHLVRQSPSFAFRNVTPAALLQQNLTLGSPMNQGLSLVQDTLGPFGNIDMKRVTCPTSLRQVYQNLTESLVLLLNVNASTVSDYQWLLQNNANLMTILETYQNLLPNNLSPFALIPPEWNTSVALCGGKLMCGFDSCGGRMAQDFFSATEDCSAAFELDDTSPSNENLLKAMLAVGLNSLEEDITLQVICSCETKPPSSCDDCVHMLRNGTFFLSTYYTPPSLAALRDLAAPVERYLRDDVKLEMLQFVTDAPDGVLVPSSVVELSRVRLLGEPSAAVPSFAAWLYLMDWVEGRREAVTFHGDSDTPITTLSDHVIGMVAPANEREIPLSFSFYAYRLSQYITGVLFCVACAVCFYIITSVARVEGMNMLTFNQVAGLVWVGRPLILVRSLTAICVLSTSTLIMDPPLNAGQLVSRMVEVSAPWYKTFLSTAELNWLVFVLEDILSIVTKQRAFTCTVQNPLLATFLTSFLTQSTMLTWTISGTWSSVAPVRHAISVQRKCDLLEVDLDVTCSSGVLAYGIPSRFCGLILLASACSVTAFGLKLVLLKRAATPPTRTSAFLPAVAQYSFDFSKWHVDDVLYIDKPSAILAGVLIVEASHAFYVFDIKNWRCYAINTPRNPIEQYGSMQHLYHALPLTE